MAISRPDFTKALGQPARPASAFLNELADTIEEITPDSGVRAVGKGELVLNMGDYGTLGTTNDATTVEACIDAVNALGDRANGTGYKGVIVLIPGRVNLPNGTGVAGAGKAVKVDGVFFTGLAPGEAVVKVTSGTAFRFGDGTANGFCKGGGVRGVKFTGDTVTSTQVCVAVDYAAEITLHDVKVAKVGQLVRAGETASRGCYGLTVSHLKGEFANSGRPSIDLRYGSGAYISHSSVYVTGVGYPQTTTETHASVGTGTFGNGSGVGSVAGTDFVALKTGSWDTTFISNTITNRYDRGLNIQVASGVVINNVLLTGAIFDYCATNAIYVSTVTGAAFTNLQAYGGYFVAVDGHGVQGVGTGGLMENIKFLGSLSVYCGKNNFRFDGVSKHVHLVDCIAQGSNRLAASNTGSDQDATVMLGSDWQIIGGCHGLDGAPNTGFANQARYGINLQTTSDRYQLIGTVLSGTTGAQSNLQAHTSGGLARRVSGVTTYTGVRVNNTASLAYTIAASGVSMTNNTGMTATFLITGGTVTAINLEGYPTGMTSGVLTVEPGDSWSITYSFAPTVRRQFAT